MQNPTCMASFFYTDTHRKQEVQCAIFTENNL